MNGHDVCVLIIRYLLFLIFPPLAVFDKGIKTILVVFLFTLCGWLPGTVLALLICMKDRNYYKTDNQC